jgi:hypothetical protein
MKLSPIAEVGVRVATAQSAEPPDPSHESDKGPAIRQAPGRQSRCTQHRHFLGRSSCAAVHVLASQRTQRFPIREVIDLDASTGAKHSFSEFRKVPDLEIKILTTHQIDQGFVKRVAQVVRD